MIGTILPWSPYPDKDTPNPATVPRGWVLCDGSEITEGDWIGRRTPDLNKSKRFLRGGHVGDALTLEEDSLNSRHTYKDFYHNVDGYGSCASGEHEVTRRKACTNHCGYDAICERTIALEGTSGETKPKNMNVVFIMKVLWKNKILK